MDGRALVGSLLPDDSIHALYLLFPTPHADARRHLVSPAFAEAVRRVLRPAAPLWFATDRVDLAEAFDACFPWSAAAPPPLGAELSRRERVCRRDGLAVYRRCVARPDTAPP
jgi:tRNA G46 methylase TrmB